MGSATLHQPAALWQDTSAWQEWVVVLSPWSITGGIGTAWF